MKLTFREKMGKQDGILTWSSAKFQAYLSDILIQVEKETLAKYFKELKELIALCQSIKEAP